MDKRRKPSELPVDVRSAVCARFEPVRHDERGGRLGGDHIGLMARHLESRRAQSEPVEILEITDRSVAGHH